MDIEVGTTGIDRDHLLRYLEIAVAAGSPSPRIVVDTPDRHPTASEVVEALGVLKDDFTNAGITLAIENHDRFGAAELAGIVGALGAGWTGVVLDTR